MSLRANKQAAVELSSTSPCSASIRNQSRLSWPQVPLHPLRIHPPRRLSGSHQQGIINTIGGLLGTLCQGLSEETFDFRMTQEPQSEVLSTIPETSLPEGTHSEEGVNEQIKVLKDGLTEDLFDFQTTQDRSFSESPHSIQALRLNTSPSPTNLSEDRNNAGDSPSLDDLIGRSFSPGPQADPSLQTHSGFRSIEEALQDCCVIPITSPPRPSPSNNPDASQNGDRLCAQTFQSTPDHIELPGAAPNVNGPRAANPPGANACSPNFAGSAERG